MSPRLSIVVPNYNHEAYLAARLESIFAQTMQDFELIYLDDASTDNSQGIAESFAGDDRMRMFRNSENSGNPFVQWNRGVREARGEYVWIAESDDLAEPGLAEGLMAVLDEHPRASFAYCRSQPIDEQGKPLPDDLVWSDPVEAAHWEEDYCEDGREEIARFMVVRSTVPNASAVLFRRQLYVDCGGAPLDFRYAGDWVTWLKLALRGDVAWVNQTWNYHRKHPNTVTSSSALDGRWAEEGYRVLAFLQSQMDIPRGQIERVCDRLMVKWVASWVHPESRLDEERQAAVFASAVAVDTGLCRRALRNIMLHRFFLRCRFVRDLHRRSRAHG